MQKRAYLFDENGEYSQKGETSKEAGVAYHAFLEKFDFSLLYENGVSISRERLEEIVEKTRKEGGMVELKQLSTPKLIEILSNPVFKKLQGKRLYKEQQFLVSLPVKDTYGKRADAEKIFADTDEEIIFQGAIDLLAVGEDGETQIIDYKFSKGGAEYLREHYRAQLELYRQAVSKILRIDAQKIKCSIINIYHGFEVNMD